MSASVDEASAGNRASLERFIVENDDLLALEAVIGRFNIFDALRMARVEIRHSNFLSFILDPAESHGQGQLFLNAVLMDLLKKAPPDLRPLSPIDLDGTYLRGVEVKREWKHVDVLISCKTPQFVLALENKIHSSEHSNQLSKYRSAVKAEFRDVSSMFVYLTPDGEEPSEEDWIPYSYRELHRVLSWVRKTYQDAIGDDFLVFLDHYLNLIRTHFMEDDRITSLCERIWKNHRRALQLIFERVGNPTSGLLAAVEGAINEDSRWHVFYRTSNTVDFLPKSWLEWIPDFGVDRKEFPKSWFVFRFELYNKSLDYYVEVRRMHDQACRKMIVDRLITEGPALGFIRKLSREAKGMYTRVSGRERVIEFVEDQLPPDDLVTEAVKARLNLTYQRIAELERVLRALCAKAHRSELGGGAK